jgi:uncharacterized repeat protein (TIGR01451 family)
MLKRISVPLNVLVMLSMMITWPGFFSIHPTAAMTGSSTEIFRTKVTLSDPTRRARLVQLGVTILQEGENWASVLATRDQQATLAKLRFMPVESNEVGLLVQTHASENLALSNSLDPLLSQAAASALIPESDQTSLVKSFTVEQKAWLTTLTGLDSDGDGLTDTEEGWWCTDPNDPNSDSPNPPSINDPNDGNEVHALMNGNRTYGAPFTLWPDFKPRNLNGTCQDGDSDSVPDNAEEMMLGLDKTKESTDGDKYDDGQELFGVTFCPQGAGACNYGALPRPIDTFLGANLPSWILPPGDSPFVAAYPIIDFQVDPASIQVTTKEIKTIERTITQGEEIATGYAETDGNSTTVGTIDTNTHSTWQENSTTNGSITPAEVQNPSSISSFSTWENQSQLPQIPQSTPNPNVSSFETDRIEEPNIQLSDPIPQPAGTRFYLPWTKGDSHEVYTDAPHGGTWAWDFKTDPGGNLLRATRPGIAYAYDGHPDGGGCSDYYYLRANWLIIDHGDGTASLYLHLKNGGALVGKGPDGKPQGQRVEQGDPVAYSGNSGYSYPCPGGVNHLHFQVQKWEGVPTWNQSGGYYQGVFNYNSYKIHFAEYPDTDKLPSSVKSSNPSAEQSINACYAAGLTSDKVSEPSASLNKQIKATGFLESIGQLFSGWWGKLSHPSGNNISIASSTNSEGCVYGSCSSQVGVYSNTPTNFSDDRSSGQCGGNSLPTSDSGFGVGGGGAGTAINNNGDGTFDALRIWMETTTNGEGWSTSHSDLRSQTTYKEITRSKTNTLVSSEAWSTATTVDPTDAAILTFNYSLRNKGGDLAVNLNNIDINILIGDLPVITWRAPDRSNIYPNQTVGPFGTDSIHLTLDQLAAIDNGAPIRVVLADYGYNDSLYDYDAWGRSVLFHVDDGLADGDRKIETYLVAKVLPNETYQDTLARYFPVSVFNGGPADARTGTITNIRTPEFDGSGQISSWQDHPVSKNSWWELSISQGGETAGFSHFKDMPSKVKTDVYLNYIVDSDGDGYTDRAELDAGTDLNNPEIHPRPLVIAGQHTELNGTTATVQLSLQNNGSFDASSVEVWAVAPDDTITISDNLVGGGGRVRAGSSVVLGARIGAPDLAAWKSSTSKPYPDGQYEGTAAKSYSFRADTAGTIGNTSGLTISWSSDGTSWTPLSVGSGYTAGNWLPIADGLKISFTAGVVAGSETFTVPTALPIDTFSYTVNNPASYSKPLIVVSYNDAQGNHKFISDVELAEIQGDLTPYQGQMKFGVQLDALSSAKFAAGANTLKISFFNPIEKTITGGNLFVEFARPDGTVVKEYVLSNQTFMPGPNQASLSWNTAAFSPAFDPAVDYHVLVFAADRQGTIIENTVKALTQLGKDNLAVASPAGLSWNFGTVTQGTLLKKEISLGNTGLANLSVYANSGGIQSDTNWLNIQPGSFSTLYLSLDTASLPVGPYTSPILLRTNDIAHPTLTINVMGTILALSGQALAQGLDAYRPWDQSVYIPGPHAVNDSVSFDHTIPDPEGRINPLYVYSVDSSTLLGVGEYGPDFSGQTAAFGIFGDGKDGDLVLSAGQNVSLPGAVQMFGTALQGQKQIPLGQLLMLNGWVPANAGWVNTGITLAAGQKVNIQASGSSCYGTGGGSCMGPQGDGNPAESNFLAPGLTRFSLVGRVGGGPNFAIGAGSAPVAGNAGVLYLAFNDTFDGYGDNQGGFSVSVTVLNLVAPPGLAVGTEVILYQAQGDTVGNYEFATIQAINGGVLVVDHPLAHSYTNDSIHKAFVMKVPHFRNVSIANAAVLTAPAWDGISGGLLVFRASGTVTIAVGGKIDMAGKGYRGGAGSHRCAGQAYSGESYNGTGTSCSSAGCKVAANFGGGGNGGDYAGSTAGGCGAGYATRGSQARQGWDMSGSAYGTADLSQIFYGSGGGGGYEDNAPCNGTGGAGGNGGGIIIVAANHLDANGIITATANNGVSVPTPPGASGGGGSGGSVFIKTHTANLGTGISALGGAGGVGSYDGANGAVGANGRIRVEYCYTATGTTNPPASSQPVTCFIARKLDGTPNTELLLPGAVDTFSHYMIQYGQHSANAAGGMQDFTVTLPKQIYSSITLDALFENLGDSNFAFSLVVGGDGPSGWYQSAAQQPIKLNSPDLAQTFNTYMASRLEIWGAPISVPIRMGLSTTGDIFLTNLAAIPAGGMDPQLGSGDLTITNSDPIETSLVTLTAKVHNPGFLAAENVMVRFYAGNPASGGTYLGSGFIPSINPNASVQTSLIWDTTGYTGPLTLYAVLDAAGQLGELDEQNNTTSLSINVHARPDLTISDITLLGDARQGLPVDVQVTTCNNGGSNSPAQITSLYLGDPANGGSLVGDVQSSLATGACAPLHYSWTPTGLGSSSLVAVTDRGAAVSEFNEANNRASQSVFIGWGAPAYIDAGSSSDLAYSTQAGLGYLSAGTVVSCNSSPTAEQTYRQGSSGGTIDYQFDNLLPDRFYHLDLSFYLCTGTRTLRVLVNNTEVASGITANSTPAYRSILIDPSLYANHTIKVSIEKTGGGLGGPVVSELKLSDIRYCYRDSGKQDEAGYAGAPDGCGWLDGTPDQSWGSQPYQTVRYDDDGSINYRFDRLDPVKAYRLNATFFDNDQAGRNQSIQVDGSILRSGIVPNATPQTLQVDIPPTAYADGAIEVAVTDANQPVISEISLEEVTDTHAPTRADLSLAMLDSPDPALSGGKLTYTLTASNSGPNTASSVTLIDTIPTGLTLLSSTPSQGFCGGTTSITCNLGSIIAGGHVTITIVVNIPKDLHGTITNTATISSGLEDSDLNNNSISQSTLIQTGYSQFLPNLRR